jgi:hypothetical protein
MTPEFIESDPKELTAALKSLKQRVDILTYVAADPANTPEPVRGMARALLDGKLCGVVSHAATPEAAEEKLRTMFLAEFERLGQAKKRGRPPVKKALEAPIGAPPADEIGEII